MTKIDFKKQYKDLYAPGAKDFVHVQVPPLRYVAIDGQGEPGNEAYVNACSWLFSVSYGVKFWSKSQLSKDYVVPPLEGLWWADDYTAYTEDRRAEWKWTLMILLPDWTDASAYESALQKAERKLGAVPDTLRCMTLEEGLCVQIMHLGPFADEAPTLARLHNEYLPQNGLRENGLHHEIYLSDPRRTAPEKLKTVLRQPVAPL